VTSHVTGNAGSTATIADITIADITITDITITDITRR
jgi:hypothetical protein